MFDAYDNLTARLRVAGDYLWPLALRLILAWEFWESGITKLRGSNWFADVPWADWQKGFPWPFSTVPADLNWVNSVKKTSPPRLIRYLSWGRSWRLKVAMSSLKIILVSLTVPCFHWNKLQCRSTILARSYLKVFKAHSIPKPNCGRTMMQRGLQTTKTIESSARFCTNQRNRSYPRKVARGGQKVR